jgi:hypothetical protein
MPSISQWTTGLFVPQGRSIGGIIAQVTIDETETDELMITEHPVEQGAAISDHAYKRPSRVTIRAGWAAQRDGQAQDLSANSGVYGYLLSWQAALNPFDLYTGKRVYHDMLIAGITVTTDQTSEFALMATISCQQIILVSTSTTQVATSTDTANHTDPGTTAPETNRGVVTSSNVDVGAVPAGSVPDFSSGAASF